MQDNIIIRLQAADLEHPVWMINQEVQQGAIEALTAAAVDKRVIVIVPAADVALLSARLPKMSQSRLKQALPYALEEQLVDEVDDLHFAVGGYEANGDLPVAVVSHEKMRQWLALLNSWQINPAVMLLETLVLPEQDQVWQVDLQETAIVRTGLYQGFSCDKENLNTMLNLAVASALQLPQSIKLYRHAGESFASALQLPVPIEEQPWTTEEAMRSAANVINSVAPQLNLLQGAYAVKRKTRLPQMDKIWKMTTCLAIAWVVLLFVYPTISYCILKARVVSINSQINQIYKRNFPKAKDMVAPKERMEQKLRSLSGSVGQNRLLTLLAYVGEGLTKASGVKLKRLSFQGNQMTLELSATNSSEFSTFTDELTQQGLTVKQQNANLNGERINATVLISN